MFKKSKNKQFDLFNSFHSHLSERKLRGIEDKMGWHNVFWSQFVGRINEDSYSVLFSDGTGRPNASVRVLLGMMVLKEANGWSDEQLFEESLYNLRVQVALGIQDLKEDPPGPTAYYDFRRRMAGHQLTTGEDLIAETFSQVTSQQVQEFNINGEKIRLDSKLIQSNIAKTTRLQLITEAVRFTLRGKDIESLKTIVTADQYKILDQLQEKSTSNITYSLNQGRKEKMLEDMGYIIHGMIKSKMINEGDTLYTIYNQQYLEHENENDEDDHPPTQITPQDKSDIKSGSVQSVHDPDAAYRKKGEKEQLQSVNGYHTNITETCTQGDKPNLIVEVNTEPANVSEAEMLCPAIAQSQKVLGEENKIKEVITDGGYDGVENRTAIQEANMPSWRMNKLRGGKRAFDMNFDVNGELIVTETKTIKKCEVRWSEKAQKYRIKGPSKKQARYLTLQQVQEYIQALNIVANSTEEHYNLRANVESTIHQTFHRLKNKQKIVYRSIIKCHWYVLTRAIWVNITRIGKYSTEMMLLFYNLANYCAIMFMVHVIAKNEINRIYVKI